MSRGNKSVGTKISIFVLFFIFMFVGVFFGVQFITKTGVFRIPGVVYYDESLSSDEKAKLEEIFSYQTDLDKDVTISAKNVLEAPNLKEGEYIYNIYVPVTDFYSTKTNLTVNSVEEIFDPTFQAANEFELIPISELDFTKKLLSLNDKYYLDELVSGAVYRIVSFDSEKFAEEIKPLVTNTFSVKAPTKDTLLTFAQTGVTALSRGMNAKLNAVGGDATYFAEGIKDFLSAFDITHTSNESSFTDYASSSNICSDKRFIDTLTAIGLDVVELTGNHNQDCGDTAALETIDTYIANGIKMVGGGKTATEAAVPLELSKKGSNITMLAFNQSTGGATYDDTPGANQYYEEVAAEQIKEAKARGDLVIVDIQYYECSAYASEYEDPTCDRANSSAGDQIGLFRHLIDLGADVVVGTSAHQAQTYELYGDGVIYYGLGNLFFDQIWWPGTTRSLVLAHYIYNGKLLQTKLVGTVYDKDMQTRLLDDETLAWWLDRLVSVRP
ncbi:CapA family protein [Candidatus Saccharibacteria bacterium]|nr:CapA family protein [Candidatus Saccharibacteria bacterium]